MNGGMVSKLPHTTSAALTTEQRAEASMGISAEAIYRLVADTLRARHPAGGTLLDVGCGTGGLWGHVRELFNVYIGADLIRYEGFPEGASFRSVNLDTGRIDLPDGVADVVACVETVEHVENPRALVRELGRLARPGGLVVVTTPNQLSLLSKLTLVLKNEFNAFQAGSYPAHLTALLEVDLRRMGNECGWADVAVEYTGSGRIPGMARHWPRFLSRQSPRTLSDNVLMIGRKLADSLPLTFGGTGDRP